MLEKIDCNLFLCLKEKLNRKMPGICQAKNFPPERCSQTVRQLSKLRCYHAAAVKKIVERSKLDAMNFDNVNCKTISLCDKLSR